MLGTGLDNYPGTQQLLKCVHWYRTETTRQSILLIGPRFYCDWSHILC
jgi:hypothetical protein